MSGIPDQYPEPDTRTDLAISIQSPNYNPRAAVFQALSEARDHGLVGVGCHLRLAAALADFKCAVPHGEFGRTCRDDFNISATYRARLLRLHEVRDLLPVAQAWAEATGSPFADCHSVENLLKLVDVWQRRDESPPTAPASNDKKSRRQLEVVVAAQASELERQEGRIVALEQQILEDDREFAALRDPLPDGEMETAADLLTSADPEAGAAFAAMAKHYRWRVKDLERELGQKYTAVQISDNRENPSADADIVER